MSRVVVFKGDESDEEIINALNGVISGMRSYGRREYTLPKKKPLWGFIWSNADASWNPGRAWVKKDGTVSLDANQFAVAGVSLKRLKGISDSLVVLPLYSGSHEARSRGEFSLEGIAIPYGIKSAFLESESTGKPLDVQTQRALDIKSGEN